MGCKAWENCVPGRLAAVENIYARIERGLFDLGFVLILGDLAKRNKSGEPVLLGRFAFDIQALANTNLPKHLCNRVTTARAIHREPLRNFIF